LIKLKNIPLHRWLAAVPTKVLWVLVLTALVSVLVFAVSEIAFKNIAQERNTALSHVQGQTSLVQLKANLIQAESAQRGFLLTLDTRYLEPYDKLVVQVRKAQANLLASFGKDPELKPQVEALGLVVEKKLDELNLTVHMARDKQPGLAMATLLTDVGLNLMQQFDTQSEALDRLLSDRANRNFQYLAKLSQEQRIGVGLVVFLNLLFLAGLGVTLVHNFVQRQQTEHVLATQTEALTQAVEDRTQELSELSTYLQNNAEEEKRALARDLHDEFGALLTSAKLDVAWLQGRADVAAPEIAGRLEQLSVSLDEAVNLKRRVIESLRPSLLDHLGLPAALQWYVQETCDRADIACEVNVPPESMVMPAHVAIDMYRLVQEAVNNAIKYAQASLLQVDLAQQDKQWYLSIKDDGIGMATLTNSHLSHGLAGMRHRVKALGGKFAIVSAPAKGTCVQAWVPLQD